MGTTSIMNGSIFKLSLIFMIAGTMIMMLVSKLRKLFSKNKKHAILYALLIILTFALAGLLSSSKVLNDTPLNSFFGFQFIFVLLGVGHLYVMRKYFGDLSEDESSFFPEFLFTLVIMLFGLIGFLNVVGRFKAPFSSVFMASSIAFMLPWLIYKLFEFATAIPVPIYKKWLYPLGKNIKDPTKEELMNPLVISFEFKKRKEENEITNFRVKAPEAMEFGKLFYFFINDYNERHPESRIEYLNHQDQQPDEWIFYFKPGWLKSARHVNFAHTVQANDIKENSIIVCERV